MPCGGQRVDADAVRPAEPSTKRCAVFGKHDGTNMAGNYKSTESYVGQVEIAQGPGDLFPEGLRIELV
jgi:hypothetical protein